MTDLSAFQNRIMDVPERINLFLGGGRGGAKTYSMLLLALRHIEQYSDRARVLFLRRTFPALESAINDSTSLFYAAYGKAASYNRADHIWRFQNGATFEFGYIESLSDYAIRYQGRNFTLLLIDEAGHWPSPAPLDKLQSNLRGPKDMPLRTVIAANPGDPGHAWLDARYVRASLQNWLPFTEQHSRKRFVYAPSTYRDNPFIDQDAYRDQLIAACGDDPELLKSWLDGTWAIARGAYFAAVIDESRNRIVPWSEDPVFENETPLFGGKRGWDREGWRFFLAHDYGSAAPSVTYVCAASPGAEGPDGRYYARGSLVLLDEFATCKRDDPNEGLRWTVPRLAEEIVALAGRWNIKPRGVADDACFAHHGHEGGSIADEFQDNGVYFKPAKKADRVTGWSRMRTMLSNAGDVDVPGLYVSSLCTYWWQTVPTLPRCPRKREDVDSSAADHAADACRYAVLYATRTGRTEFSVVPSPFAPLSDSYARFFNPKKTSVGRNWRPS